MWAISRQFATKESAGPDFSEAGGPPAVSLFSTLLLLQPAGTKVSQHQTRSALLNVASSEELIDVGDGDGHAGGDHSDPLKGSHFVFGQGSK